MSERRLPPFTEVAMASLALIVAGGIVATSWPVAIVGAVVIVLCLITTAIVHHLAGGAPVSFGEEYPATTSGPRATRDGDSRPPIDTDPSAARTTGRAG